MLRMSVHFAFASARVSSFHQGIWVSGATRLCTAKCHMQKRLHSSLETYLDGVKFKQLTPLGKPFQIRLYLVQSSNGNIPLGTLEIDMIHRRIAAARKETSRTCGALTVIRKSKLWPASRNIRTNRICSHEKKEINKKLPEAPPG